MSIRNRLSITLLCALALAACSAADSSMTGPLEDSNIGADASQAHGRQDGASTEQPDSGTDERPVGNTQTGSPDAGPSADAGPSPEPDAAIEVPDAEAPIMTLCEPGTTLACYTGPAGTQDVGACHAGLRTCDDDGESFGPCEGEVTPTRAVCADADIDCNGTADDEQDLDGDGFTLCDNDCCDGPLDGCTAPALVNPGAYDYPGNELDDDCNGTADDSEPCDEGLASDSTNALHYARAFELCQTTTQDPPLRERRWGILSSAFSNMNDVGYPNPAQLSIRPRFGGVQVQRGTRMSLLSTGSAAAVDQVAPSYVAPIPGPAYMGYAPQHVPPADWLAAYDGVFPTLARCSPPVNREYYDSAMLTLQVRVPTNANAFSVRVNFITSEFPEFPCDAFADRFLVLLTTAYAGDAANPFDGNIATYFTADGGTHVLSATSALSEPGLFRQCINTELGCEWSRPPGGPVTSCVDADELINTGFDTATSDICVPGSPAGGGTGWVTVSGNVVGGEVMRLRLVIWDQGDAQYTSTALIDAFTWHPEAVVPGVTL